MRVRLPRLRRHPMFFWLLAAVVAGSTGAFVAGLVSTAQARARAWGDAATVLVTTRAVEAGHVLGPGDLVEREVPVALLPDSPAVLDAGGRAAVVAMVGGEVVTEAKVAPWGAKGLGPRVPKSSRALAVPLGPAAPPLSPGDRVDLLATFAPEDAGDGDPTFPVARAGLVLAVDDESVTVAVRATEAPRVAFALARAVVTVALTRPEIPNSRQ
ncbi:MAG TPA: SAF domain-containing protein [Acidimicrobiales bacterium]|nr:SAF domain-containing protein [Acidimicrobiales bacterium]